MQRFLLKKTIVLDSVCNVQKIKYQLIIFGLVVLQIVKLKN